MEHLQEAYEKYENSLAISFNGGKESTVILDLVFKINPKILVYYVINKNEFSEILEFIDKTCIKYKIDLLVYNDMKDAIIKLKEKGIKGIITGVRKSDDPNIKLYCMSDKGWPEIIRINPLVDWSYSDVWKYIIDNNVDYCKLYNMGYTSLGNINNTFTNFKLFNGNNYNPAYKLENITYERVARIKKELPITLLGKVIHGKGIAKKILGIATANLEINSKLEIDEGVYYGKIILDLKEYIFVSSYGMNPTTNDESFEVHILNFDRNIYDTMIEIELTGYIRPMEKFLSLENLRLMIEKDIDFVRFITFKGKE